MATADPSFDQSLVGAVLSRRFRLTQELGRGGMGAVYAAQPVDGGRPVAVKILHATFVGDQQVMNRFLDEGRTCMRLHHGNILRVHEVLTAEDGSPYLVMDLLDGIPLAAYTKNGGRIAVPHAVPILQGMLAGLHAAHEQGVVHRDLKPGNVFLAREEGGLFVVKLLDFGIAKVMDVAGGMGSRTKTGMLLGTPAYMSPEQIKNAKDVDARADLWSAGVMFYEMLTGRTAFPAPTEYARLTAVLSTEPEPVERVDRDLLPLAPFIARALQKDRGARFQSALEMSKALLSTLAPDGAAAAPPQRGAQETAQSRVLVTPLSRLPDRAWVDAYVVTAPNEAPPPIAAPRPPLPPPPPPALGVSDTPDLRTSPVPTPSTTLASPSPSSPPGAPAPEPQVVVVPSSLGGTLPSETARKRRRSGVAPGVVVLLVVGALAAGLALGYALGHL
jgi:serine/threonine protein kinase